LWPLGVTKASAAIDLWAKERCADPVKDKLKRFELFAHFGEQSFFPTIVCPKANYESGQEKGQFFQ
jgi:hypothetical protein